MHDIRAIRENPAAFDAALARRGAAPMSSEVLALDEARRARMIEHFAQTEASLERLRGPIGIYIGSKTPPEIAVSVMAEILAVKNGVTLPRDMEVAQAKNDRELAHNDPGALVCGVRAA
jgi:xanthine dehydrogenase accessory factor